MARPMGPRFKQSRRFGVNIFGHPKELNRGVKTNRKVTEYGKQLIEKQKLKAYYGLSEKQMLRYVKDAFKESRQGKGLIGDLAVARAEKRLDNLVYRAGFASSLRQARQFVVHGHISLNGQKTTIPSLEVKAGDSIGLTPRGQKLELIKENVDASTVQVPYLQRDNESKTAVLERDPERDEVPIELTDSLVVEFYSKSI
ncbi:MAG: 30S ribosomal protein S4 [Tissierellia bacterium]|nr:30S ribosomal protein S4 [Tissierellia bacterium]